jgi:hypothetical protein
MNWYAVGAAASLISTMAFVVSVVFVALELRRSNRLTQRAAAQKLVDTRVEYQKYIGGDPDLCELWWRGLLEPEELNAVEWRRFFLITAANLRFSEAIFEDYEAGFLSEHVWELQKRYMKRWFSKPGIQKVLKELSLDISPSFVRLLLVESPEKNVLWK